jgi:hypothetical protein
VSYLARGDCGAWSRGPVYGDATVEQADGRGALSPPCAPPGSDPRASAGPLSRLSTRPNFQLGIDSQANAARGRRAGSTIPPALSEAAA